MAINLYQLENYCQLTEGLRDCNPEVLEEHPDIHQKVIMIEVLTKSLQEDLNKLAEEQDED